MTLSTDFNSLKHHLAITSSSIIAEIMFLTMQIQKHNIKIFNFVRQYDDSSIIRLSSDAIWNEHYFNKGYINKRNKVPKALLAEKINYFIWITEHWPEMLSDLAVNFNIGNGITVAEKFDKYTDFFCFGADVSNKSIINFYLNHLDLLKNYGHEFREKAKSLLNEFEKDKIIIPSNVVYAGGRSRQIFDLTSREVDCAMQLVMSNNIKEIARKLRLSPRTVETHINNMKAKLNCRNKVELAIKLSKLL